MTTQHAPSPDYSSSEGYLDIAVRECPDCGDLIMTIGDEDRCEACVQYQTDEAAAFARDNSNSIGLFALIATMKSAPLDLNKSGGMNDERTIMCDECGVDAVHYSCCVDDLDGKACECLSCGEVGKVYVDQDDEGRVYARFRSYNTAELDALAAEGKACTECLSLAAVNDDGVCNECDEHAERRSMGW